MKQGAREFCVVLMLLAWIVGPPSLRATTISWTKGDPNCELSGGSKISCGHYGVFYVGTGERCEGGIGGVDEPRSYPLPIETPELAEMLTSPSEPQSEDPQGHPTAPWMAIIDFLYKNHGAAVQWVAEELGLGQVGSRMFHVDDPALIADLGPEIGDFHLLASLCSVAEGVDVDRVPAPSVVNMSLGRQAAPGDRVDLATCDPETILCQIGWVIEHIRARGTAFAAATGNHRQKLIPSALSNVVAVGAADLRKVLVDREMTASWESPEEPEGVFPANGLCLRGGLAAPAGSSYASAIFSGWVAQAKTRLHWIDPLSASLWKPLWWEQKGCFVLSADGAIYTRCNAGFDEIVSELSGGPGNCWESQTYRLADGGPMPESEEFPDYDSFDLWASVHPTPEADPCVPCLGDFSDNLGGGSEDLVINVSQSKPLPPGEHLQLVFLRVGTEFFPLSLNGAEIQAIENGTADYLFLPGWLPLIDYQLTASLFYVASDLEQVDCPTTPSQCYWSSTQVTWHPSLL